MTSLRFDMARCRQRRLRIGQSGLGTRHFIRRITMMRVLFGRFQACLGCSQAAARRGDLAGRGCAGRKPVS